VLGLQIVACSTSWRTRFGPRRGGNPTAACRCDRPRRRSHADGAGFPRLSARSRILTAVSRRRGSDRRDCEEIAETKGLAGKASKAWSLPSSIAGARVEEAARVADAAPAAGNGASGPVQRRAAAPAWRPARQVGESWGSAGRGRCLPARPAPPESRPRGAARESAPAPVGGPQGATAAADSDIAEKCGAGVRSRSTIGQLWPPRWTTRGRRLGGRRRGHPAVLAKVRA